MCSGWEGTVDDTASALLVASSDTFSAAAKRKGAVADMFLNPPSISDTHLC